MLPESLQLLERDREIRLTDLALRRARHGEGGVLAFEGAPGIGKTSILRTAREEGAAQGFGVLHARGSELEQDFLWGVVRQLFESWLSAVPAEEAAEALSGPASLAESLFDPRTASYGVHASPDEEELHSRLHGLYWLCRNVSSQQPLLVVVDDAQWADPPSLRFLSYLANRLEELPIQVVLATTPAEQNATGDLLADACTASVATFARLAPLSPEAVRKASEEILGRSLEESFARACHAATEGNPLLLRELLEDVATEGIEPVETAVSRIRHLAPRRVAMKVLRWLNRLSPQAKEFAVAVAVLGADAEPRHCAYVAGLDQTVATEAAGELRDAHILRHGVPHAFVRPIMQQVVYASASAQSCNAAHHRAGHSLEAAGAPATAVATHLCKTEPGSDPWVVDVLRAAARAALADGDPQAAVRHLRRALAEPPADSLGAQILAELGAAELRAGDPVAIEHLREALSRTPKAEQRTPIQLDLCQACIVCGRNDEAARILADVQAREGELGAADEQARTLLSLLTRLFPGGARQVGSRPLVADRTVSRAGAALRALCRGAPARRVARLAHSALADGIRLTPHDVAPQAASLAAWMLMECDRLPAAERVLTQIVQQAEGTGHVFAGATAESLKAMVLLETGRIDAAEAATRAVLRRQAEHSLRLPGVPLASAVLVQTLIETARLDEAEEHLEHVGLADTDLNAAICFPLHIARGRLRILQGRFEDGAQALLACRRHASEQGWGHPGAVIPYLTDLVRALLRTGNPSAARALAEEERERARAFGAPRPLAVTLRTCGELTGGQRGIDAIEEAAQLLSGQPELLEGARTQVALGAALRRAGRRAAARKSLMTGMEMARGYGATAIERSAQFELRLSGARSWRGAPSGDGQLTPAEQRVVRQASQGLSNKEISQALFVTVKTVEWHLTQAYSKLGISRRSELSRALTDAGLLTE